MPTGRFLGGVLAVMQALEDRRNNAATLQLQQQQLNQRAQQQMLDSQIRQDALDLREQTRLDKQAGIEGDQQGYATIADLLAPRPRNGPMGPQMGPNGPVPPPSPYGDPYSDPRLGQALSGMSPQAAANAMRMLETRQYHGQMADQGQQRIDLSQQRQGDLNAYRGAQIGLGYDRLDQQRQSAAERLALARTAQEASQARFEWQQEQGQRRIEIAQQNANTMAGLAQMNRLRNLDEVDMAYGQTVLAEQNARKYAEDARKVYDSLVRGLAPDAELLKAKQDYEEAQGLLQTAQQVRAAARQAAFGRQGGVPQGTPQGGFGDVRRAEGGPVPSQVPGDASEEPLIEQPGAPSGEPSDDSIRQALAELGDSATDEEVYRRAQRIEMVKRQNP